MVAKAKKASKMHQAQETRNVCRVDITGSKMKLQ